MCIQQIQDKHGTDRRIGVFIDTIRTNSDPMEGYDEHRSEPILKILNPLKKLAIRRAFPSGSSIIITGRSNLRHHRLPQRPRFRP